MESKKLLFFMLISLISGHVASRPVNLYESWTLPQEDYPYFYRAFYNQLSWDAATDVCESYGAELLTVEGNDIRDATTAFIKETDIDQSVWLGLQRATRDSPYIWTGGSREPVREKENFMMGDAYVPERLCGKIQQRYNFMWDVSYCDGGEKLPFICQLPVPDWAKGETGCLIDHIPSLTITYLPDEKTVELLSVCGLSGTKRTACRGNENKENLLKRISCDSVEENRGSTQSLTEKTPHGTEVKWGSTTISDWVSGGTTRSWGTRHRRESGGTSTSTDTSPIETDESNPAIQDINKKLDHPPSKLTKSGEPEIFIFNLTPIVLPSGGGCKNPMETIVEESSVTTGFLQESSPGVISIEAVGNDAKKEVDSEFAVESLKNGEEEAFDNAGQILSTSKTQENNLDNTNNKIATSSGPMITSTTLQSSKDGVEISTVGDTTTTSQAPRTTTVLPPKKEVSYQINPPLTLRSGKQPVEKNAFSSQDVIDLSAKPILTEEPTTEEAVPTDFLFELGELKIIHLVDPRTPSPISVIHEPVEESNNEGNTDVEEVPTVLMKSKWNNKKMPFNAKKENLAMNEAEMHELPKALEREALVSGILPDSQGNALFDDLTTDDAIKHISESNKVNEIQSSTEGAITSIPIITDTNIPIIVIEESGNTNKNTPAFSPPITEVRYYTADQNNASSYHDKNETNDINLATTTLSVMNSENIPVQEKETVQVTSRPDVEEIGDEEQIVKQPELMKDVDIVNTETATTEAPRSTNEPNDTVFDTTTHTQKSMQSTVHEIEKAVDIHGSDDNADDGGPKRPNRGRFFPHSSPLSFYPYFINRVLG